MSARPMPQHPPLQLLRLSLVAVWLWTAAASLLQWQGESTALLAAGGITSPDIQAWLIGAGVALDLLLGLWLLWRPGRAAYAASFAAMLAMTLAATALLPSLWLHPLGPLSKNLPIAAALWLLWQSSPCDGRSE
ncbi:MAG: DoxX-like family protein [Comamonas sp.]|nr:DoxX-like family protein [Comamonas sp.]